MKENWLLDPSVTYLNHGSFGATPRVVLEKQQQLQRRMEKEPVLFLVLQLEPLMDDQELDARASTGTIYWEGAVRAFREKEEVGRGYLELTGYWKPMKL